MQNVSVRLEPDTIDTVEQEATEKGKSRAAYLREIIEDRHDSEAIRSEYEEILDEHEEDRERLQAENDRLERRVSTLIQQQDERDDLVNYVSEERRERERARGAGAFQRFAWWLLGDPAYQDEE
jgi:predicted phage gp36 major capsid-like protein